MTTKKTRATPATPTGLRGKKLLRAAPAGLRGKELLRAAVNQIIRHPETWDQGDWHCGTSHCVGGHCQILAGHEVDRYTARNQVVEAVGLSDEAANWLFDAGRSLSEIRAFAVSFLADEPFFPCDYQLRPL